MTGERSGSAADSFRDRSAALLAAPDAPEPRLGAPQPAAEASAAVLPGGVAQPAAVARAPEGSGGSPQPATVRLALLAVDAVEYAVESSWVRRSLPAPDPLPAVILHGGAAFPVIDLRQVFRLPPHPVAGSGPPGPERLILLLERPPRQAATGDAAGRWALVVDDLLGLEPLAPGAVAVLPAVYRGPERRWFSGVVPRAGGRVIVLLNLDGLGLAAAPRTGGAAC